MRSVRMTIWVMVVNVCLSVLPAFGILDLNDGATYNISWEINDAIRVDYETQGIQTTVNILDGATITDNLSAYQDSQVNMSGGLIDGELHAYESSQVTFSGGTINEDVEAQGNSLVNISGGLISRILWAKENSRVTVSNGLINVFLSARQSSHVTFSGGTINEYLAAFENSQVTVSGGSIGEIGVDDSALLTIEGSDFAIDGIPVGYVTLTSIYGWPYDSEPYRHLTGTLASGELLDNNFRIGGGASIVLTPEPCTLVLLGIGGLLMRSKRRG